MNKFKKIVWFAFAAFALSFGALFFWLSNQYTVPIMMYHHIANQSNEELNTTSPENFQKHMAYLNQNGYQVITLDALVTAISKHQPLERNSVVITFDDGYENNFTNGFPVLKKYNYPATIFMVSNFIDQKDYLKLDQMKEMIDSGLVDIGSHTKNHQYLPKAASQGVLEDEIVGSKKDLEKLLSRQVKYFCYPSGGFSEAIKELVRLAGYNGALATNRGFAKQKDDVFELKRIRFNNKDYNSSLMMKLSGYSTVFKRSRNPY